MIEWGTYARNGVLSFGRKEVIWSRLRSLLIGVLMACLSPELRAGDDAAGWNKEAAAKYLDARAEEWFAFTGAAPGKGATKTSCISCHTLLPYALSRPALRKVTGTTESTAYEQKLLSHATQRVNAWAKLDTPDYRLFYDFD